MGIITNRNKIDNPIGVQVIDGECSPISADETSNIFNDPKARGITYSLNHSNFWVKATDLDDFTRLCQEKGYSVKLTGIKNGD